MSDEEEIKKKMMQQKLHQLQQEELQSHMQQKQLEDALKAIMQQVLEPAARERLANIKMVKPELALQLEAYLAQLYQAGQLKGKITDAQVVSIMQKLSAAENRDFRIKRK